MLRPPLCLIVTGTVNCSDGKKTYSRFLQLLGPILSLAYYHGATLLHQAVPEILNNETSGLEGGSKLLLSLSQNASQSFEAIPWYSGLSENGKSQSRLNIACFPYMLLFVVCPLHDLIFHTRPNNYVWFYLP